jgi:cell division inhibitor SepF
MGIKGLFDRVFYLYEDEDEEDFVEEQKPTSKPSRKQQVAQPVEEKPVATAKPVQPKKERRGTVTTAENQPKLVSLQAATAAKNSKVVLVEPRVYAEAQDIAENLKNKRATIVNLQRIDRDQAIRIIDFLSGSVYALGGEIQRVGTNIFLCTPDNVEVSGEISEYLYEDI